MSSVTVEASNVRQSPAGGQSLSQRLTTHSIHTFRLTFRSDPTTAHQPALIVLTDKFRNTGLLASLRCQLSIPVALWSILSTVSKSVKVQFTGFSVTHFLSTNEF